MLRSMRFAGRPKPYLFAEPARLQTAPVGRFSLEVADLEFLICNAHQDAEQTFASPSSPGFARAVKDPWQMLLIPEFELG